MATAAAAAAGTATTRGVKAAAAASGAGAIARSSADQVAGNGSTLSSAEMVMSCAAPASKNPPRRQALLLEADRLGTAVLMADALVADALAGTGC
jgi:hypothetical protein